MNKSEEEEGLEIIGRSLLGNFFEKNVRKCQFFASKPSKKKEILKKMKGKYD